MTTQAQAIIKCIEKLNHDITALEHLNTGYKITILNPPPQPPVDPNSFCNRQRISQDDLYLVDLFLNLLRFSKLEDLVEVNQGQNILKIQCIRTTTTYHDPKEIINAR